MSKDTPINTSQKPSALDKFTLDFEYDKTIREVKRAVRLRTHMR